MKNLVIITCAVKVPNNSVFSVMERLSQIFMSIMSVRNKIPDSYIVLLETGSAPQEYADFLKQHVDEYISMDVTDLNKNQGEATMLYTYVMSKSFQEKKSQFVSVSKLSGRYFLNDQFKFDKYPLEKPLILWKSYPNDPDGKTPHYETRYYRFPNSYIDTFCERFDSIIRNHFDLFRYGDVEHTFYDYGLFKPEDCTCTDIVIGVTGYISGSGHLICE